MEYGDGRSFQQWDSVDNVEVDLEDVVAAEQNADLTAPIGVLIARLATRPEVVAWATARGISVAGLAHRITLVYNRVGPSAGAQLHHLATIANSISSRTGGPWTPRFALLFARYSISLNHPLNKVSVYGHRGSHSEPYHRYIWQRLSAVAARGFTDFADELDAFLAELMMLAVECATPGTVCNNLLMRR